jgi:hypothetical protein
MLSLNPNLLNAIHILEKYPEKIKWERMSENPNAIHILESHPDKIHWYSLSENPNAMHLLEAYFKNQPAPFIDWDSLSANPSIFEIDTKQMNIELIKRAKNIDF